MKQLDFKCSAAAFASALARQPNPGGPLLVAIEAAFACLSVELEDEREWHVVAELHYPEDSLRISISPTSRSVPQLSTSGQLPDPTVRIRQYLNERK